MIYIITESFDPLSTEVVKWLDYYGAQNTRLDMDSIGLVKYEAAFSAEPHVPSEDIVFIRRFAHLYLPPPYQALNEVINNELYHGFIRPLYQTAKKRINTPWAYERLNKFDVLTLAESFGLRTPKTIITNRKNELIRFLEKHQLTRFVTKPAHEILRFSDNETIYKQYTTALDANETSNLPETFFFSLFQEQIQKQYDVKTVCIGDTLYSTGLRSASGAVDIRQDKHSVQYVPIELPRSIATKLLSLLQHLKLQVCTVDFVLDKTNEFVFLEINPGGQLADLSYHCNFHLEERISQYLIHEQAS